MDAKKAFGVETALGKAIAQHDLEPALRRVTSADELRRFVESVETTMPRALVTEWAQGIEDSAWQKARSKLLVGSQLARGKIQEMSDEDVERHGVGHRA